MWRRQFVTWIVLIDYYREPKYCPSDNIRQICQNPPPHSGPGGGRINFSKCTKSASKWGIFTLDIAFPKTGMLFNNSPNKMDFRPKIAIWQLQGHFGQSSPKNGPPSGQTATHRKTKCIKSYLRIWGSYDPIESDPSEPKNGGFYGCSVKKSRFLGQKWAPAPAQRPAVQRGQHKNVVFLVSRHDGNNNFGWCLQIMDFGPKNCIFGSKEGHFGHSEP